MSEAKGSVVVLSMERYNELIQIETRVDVVVERVANEKYIQIDSLLRILNTEKSIYLAEKIKREQQEMFKKLEEEVIKINEGGEI